MPAYNVGVLPIALEDIAEIYRYCAYDDPNAALRLTGEIMDSIDTLSTYPESCPIVQDSILAQRGYRVLIIKDYAAFFKVLKSEVLVYRVLREKSRG